MKILFPGTSVSAAVRSVPAAADVCAWDRVATGAYLTRTRAFADVPVVPENLREIPVSGLAGSRPGGSPAPQRHVDLAPQRPRPSGGPPQD